MSESFNLIYSYTRAQAIEDGVLIYFHVLFQTSITSEGKPVTRLARLKALCHGGDEYFAKHKIHWHMGAAPGLPITSAARRCSW